jgi:putative membrane protein
MTTIDTPPPASPRRSGFYVAPWVLAVIGGIVLLGIGFVVGRAVGRHHDGAHPFFRAGDGGGHHGLGVLIVLIVLALLVTGVVLLVRHYSASRAEAAAAVAPSATTATSAEQVLADRFARGEIDEAEFVSRRDALRR